MTADPRLAPSYCYNHPDRETMLRCNRCERPICTVLRRADPHRLPLQGMRPRAAKGL